MKKRLVLSLFSILLVSLLFSPYMFSQETPGTVVRVAPRPLSDNDSHRVDIVIENGQAVTGYQVMLQYDSRYIEYVDTDNGNYLPDNAFFGAAQMRDTDPNDSLKAILIAATAFPNRSEGDGVLATLTFKTIIAEPSDLTLLDVTLLSHEVVDNKVVVSSPQLENSRTQVVEAPDLVIQSFGASLEKNSITLIDLKREITLKQKDVFYLYVSFYNMGAETSDQTRVVYSQADGKTTPKKTKGRFVSLSGNKPVHKRLPRVAPDTPGTYYYTVCVEPVTGESKTHNNCSDAIARTVKITVNHRNIPPEAPQISLSLSGSRTPERFSRSLFISKGSLSGEMQTPGDVHYFKVHPDENGKLTLWTTGDLGTSGELLESDNTSLVSDYIASPGSNFQIQSDVSRGFYYVKVTAIGTGSYTIHASFAPSAACDRPKVHVIWYHAANESIRGPEAGIFRQLHYNYISPNNVKDNLEDVQDFFDRELLGKTFDLATLPSGDIHVEIQSSNFFVDAIPQPPTPNSNHFTEEGNTPEEFFNKVLNDIRNNHQGQIQIPIAPDPLKDIYLVLVQSNYGYLGEKKGNGGTRGKANSIGGHVAMVALGSFSQEWSNESIKILIAHELGHVFGLFHDFSKQGPIMAYNYETAGFSFQAWPILTGKNDHLDSNWLSERSKNWLDVHPAFNNYSSCNVDTPIEIKVKDVSSRPQQPKILTSYGYYLPDVGPRNDIHVFRSNGKYKIHLDITDLDGLHHVELIAPPLDDSPGCTGTSCAYNSSLARYLYAGSSDPGVSGNFSSGLTTWSGTFDITEWMEQEQKRGSICFDAFIATTDKAGNRSGFWLRICKPPASNAFAPSAQKHLPKETALLPNYPNPFNPETWIPYQLATHANVTLTIYDIQGRVVRELDLGHQRAGMYHTRSRAAYWDGRNAVGELVASGVFFYTLTVGEFTATRKMLIRK